MGFLDTLKTLFGGSDDAPQTPPSAPQGGSPAPQTPEESPVDKEVIKFLKSEGLQPETNENGRVIFKYQRLTFVYFPARNDSQFIHLALPCIYEFAADNRSIMLEAANKVNTKLKCAKLVATEDDIWISAEGLMDSTPNLKDFMPRMIDLLLSARENFYEELK